MDASGYPLPLPDACTQPFWAGCAAGQLRYQQCAQCAHVQRIPRDLCEHCQCRRLQWMTSQRLGTVLSFTTVYRAPLPAFKSALPYVIALLDMDEGFRIMANALPQVQQGPLAIGARVRVGFTEVHGMALPVVHSFEEIQT